MSSLPVHISPVSQGSTGGSNGAVTTSWASRLSFLNPVNWMKKSDLPNPGLVEDFSKDVVDTRIEQSFFDGAKVAFSRSHNNGFHSTHSFMMGSSELPNMYQLNTIYVNDRVFLQASLDNQSSRSGVLKYSFTDKVKGTLRVNVGPRMNMMATELDYLAGRNTFQVKATNIDPFSSAAVLYGGYLRHVTPSVVVGAEVVSNVQQGTARDFNNTVLLAKKNKEDSYFLRLMPGAVNVAYYRKVGERVHLVADLSGGVNAEKTITDLTLAAKFDFRASIFRASVNTNGTIAAHLEHSMAPGVALLISGEIDHKKDSGRFGFGFQLGH